MSELDPITGQKRKTKDDLLEEAFDESQLRQASGESIELSSKDKKKMEADSKKRTTERKKGKSFLNQYEEMVERYYDRNVLSMVEGEPSAREVAQARRLLELDNINIQLDDLDMELEVDGFGNLVEEEPELTLSQQAKRDNLQSRKEKLELREKKAKGDFVGTRLDPETGEPIRQKTIRERRRRQKENRKAKRLRNADLTKLTNLFADGKADVTSAINGLVSMYNKAAASGGGAAFIATLADDLFEDNKKAAGKFLNLIKSNPLAAFQMAGKGLMVMAMDGLPLTAALMPLMPVAANQDEQELLNSITDLNDDPFIKNSDNSEILNITGSNYYKRFMPAIKNELSLDSLMDENITTEKFSPEAIGTIKNSLDKYFAANPEQTQVDTSSAFLGILYQDTLMDMITATRNPDGSYQLSDATDPSKNNNILAAGRRYSQGLAEKIDQPLTANSDWFANQFEEDSINIDIKIPPVINAVSDAMDDHFGIEETALVPKFKPNPLTQSRLSKMNAVLNTKDIPVVETPGFADILGFNEVFTRNRNAGQSVFTWRGDDYTTLSRDEQELLNGEDTSMDTQGGQEPEGGIERGGSQVVQEGDAQATS